jgi:hypothetical protein
MAVGLFSPLILVAQDAGLNRRTPESEAARIKLERRITLDIEVADSTGNAVRGLSQNDFVVLDKGDPKPLTSFQEIDGRTVQPPVEAILLDAMNATLEDVGIMRQGIDAFLRQDGASSAPGVYRFSDKYGNQTQPAFEQRARTGEGL